MAAAKEEGRNETSPFGMLLAAFGLGIGFDSIARIGEAVCSRTDLTRKYSFAIPDKPALELLASYGPIVELGAGTGYWASLLTKMGTQVVAYDRKLGEKNDYGWTHRWFDVQHGTSARAADHPDHTLLLCWPDYNSRFAGDCLRHYRGDRVVYIGEGRGGCTGSDRFHDELNTHWAPVEGRRIPQWPGIHDRIYVYERRIKQRRKRKGQSWGHQKGR